MNTRRVARFILVGGIGFLTDAGMLLLLLRYTGLDPFTARLIAIAVALQVTWLLNRRFTFGRSTASAAVEGVRYNGVGIATSIFNYLVYSGLLLVFSGLPPLAALVVASAAATVLSYTGYARLVFGR